MSIKDFIDDMREKNLLEILFHNDIR